MNNPFELFQNKDTRTEAESRKLVTRTAVLMGIFCAVLLAFVGVLYNYQVVHGQDHLASSNVTYFQTETVDTVRGEILDRSGNPLVTNALSYRVRLDTSLMGRDRNDILTDLLALCREEDVEWRDSFPISKTYPWVFTRESPLCYEGTDDEGNAALYPTMLGTLAEKLKWVADATEDELSAQELMIAMCDSFGIDLGKGKAITRETRDLLGVLYELYLRIYEITYNEYFFARDVDITFITRVKELSLPGVEIVTDTTRQYVTDSAAHLLGRTGAIDPDEWPAYRELGYPMDAFVGKDGAEYAFEQYLRGWAGVSRTELDESGNILNQTWSTQPQPGNNVVLTISEPLQSVTEELLAQFVSTLEEPAGAAAVMVDMTGGVLAMASYPDYDLATYSQTYNDLLADPAKPLLNRATMGLYAPGSTYKPLVAMAALASDTIGLNETVYCAGIYDYYPDTKPRCWIYTNVGGHHGTESISKAITDSCNIFFYDVGRRMGIQTLVSYATQFGLGQYTGIELPEYKGRVAGPETSVAVGQTWYGGSTMFAAIGQENNQFTPLQMANYLATLVNGGNRYQVHLLKEVLSADYSSTVYTHEPVLLNSIELNDRELAVVKQGMYDLAKTRTMAPYFSTLPVEVGCKTGTAEVTGTAATATFMCFAPYDDPQVALFIVVEKGSSGGNLASIAAGMLSQYFAAQSAQNGVEAEGSLIP